MKKEDKRIAIAEECGWKFPKDSGANGPFVISPTGVEKWHKDDPVTVQWSLQTNIVPDYFNNLNAIHSAVRTLDDVKFHAFTLKLCEISWLKHPRQTHECHADYINRLRISFAGTAEEQSEAFGLALQLWEN